MAGISRNTDLSIGADRCKPAIAMWATCADVLIEKLPPLVAGNLYGKHMGGGKHCRHMEAVCCGFPKIIVNGSPVLISLLPLSHGDIAGKGSVTVTVA